jgi:hypothetical protein
VKEINKYQNTVIWEQFRKQNPKDRSERGNERRTHKKIGIKMRTKVKKDISAIDRRT